jgi:osmotically-inducible protein OsmY
MAHAGVRHSHVFVLTRGGDVTLTGWVDDFNQVPLAGAAAAAVPGVTSVTNWVTRGR